MPATSNTVKESPAKSSPAKSKPVKNTKSKATESAPPYTSNTADSGTTNVGQDTSVVGKATSKVGPVTSKIVGGGQPTESKAPVNSQTYGGDTSSPAEGTTAATYSYNPPVASSNPEGVIGQSRTHVDTQPVTTDDTTVPPAASSQPVYYSTGAEPTVTFSYNPGPTSSPAAGESAYPPAGTSTYAPGYSAPPGHSTLPGYSAPPGHSAPPYESQHFSFAPGASHSYPAHGPPQSSGAAPAGSAKPTTFDVSYNPHATSGHPGHQGTWSQPAEAKAGSSTQSYVPYITKAFHSASEAAHQSVFTFHGHTYHLGGATLNAQASSTAKSTETSQPGLASGAGSTRGLSSCSWAVLGVVVGAAALL